MKTYFIFRFIVLLVQPKISTQLHFNQAEMCATFDPSACKMRPEGREFVADSQEPGGRKRHAPGGGIIALVCFLTRGSYVVVLAFGSQQYLEVSKKRLLGQFCKTQHKLAVYHRDTALVAKKEVIELVSILHDRGPFREDLAVQRRKHFADKDLVGEVLILDVVEEVEKLFVVGFKKGENQVLLD
jgi:hypothetical protein